MLGENKNNAFNEMDALDQTEGETPTKDGEKTPNAESEREAALAAEKDKYLRLAAEYDNFRKRSTKEREVIFSDVRTDTVLRFLPVYDNLSRALNTGCSDEAFYKGIELTLTQLKEILAAMGVSEIPAVGEQFDPEKHNAVMHIENETVGENVIVEEFEKGFTLGDKVIRFSVVTVAN